MKDDGEEVDVTQDFDFSTLPERYVKAIRNLMAKKDLTILPADKGGAVGVMYTTKYISLGLDVLGDTNTFAHVQDNDVEGSDVTAMQKSHNARINDIANKVDNVDMKKKIKNLGSPPTPNMPHMTGYPKFHKDPIKVRPVISNIKAPHSNSSKWCAKHLSRYVGLISSAHIKNTKDFHEKVRMNKAKGRLLSLDVKSLFTNVPVNEAIDVVRSYSSGPNPLFKDLPITPNFFVIYLNWSLVVTNFTF